MIKSIYICDLCGKQYAERSQGHASAIDNDNPSLNYSHIDKVKFPPSWRKVGVNAICENCDNVLKERILLENRKTQS
ncbi:hypothetical protein N9064_00475 [bacterium]|nr:hypothetical protein [bacterium]